MIRRVLACGLAVALGPLAFADEPIKDKKVLDARLAQVAHGIAEKHVSLSKKFEGKKNTLDAYNELLLALILDPDDKAAREKLGYKKEGDKWLGAPPPAQPQSAVTDPALAKQREKERKESAKQLSALAKRAKAGGLESDARRVAGLALEEASDDKDARAVLGHESKGEAWASARELKVRAAFTKAFEKAKPGEDKKDAGDEDLGKLLGFGALVRAQSPHGVLLATAQAPETKMLPDICRSVEATWAAYRYFFAGEDEGFVIDGEPRREASGAAPEAPKVVLRWLCVAPNEHASYIEKTVADKKLHSMAKGLNGWGPQPIQVASADGGRIWVFESRFAPTVRTEWASSTLAEVMLLGPLKGAKCPDFIVDGVKRFFGCRVSGRVDIFYVSAGSSTSKRQFHGGSLDTLRALVRPTLQGQLEGELRSLLSRNQNELDTTDTAAGFAFIDWCFATQRGELAAFLAGLSKDEAPIATFEKAFKRSVEEVEKDFRAWAREEF